MYHSAKVRSYQEKITIALGYYIFFVELLLVFAITYSSLGNPLFAKHLQKNKKILKTQLSIQKTGHRPIMMKQLIQWPQEDKTC